MTWNGIIQTRVIKAPRWHRERTIFWLRVLAPMCWHLPLRWMETIERWCLPQVIVQVTARYTYEGGLLVAMADGSVTMAPWSAGGAKVPVGVVVETDREDGLERVQL